MAFASFLVFVFGVQLVAATDGFDCNALLDNFFRAWSPEKKQWCCKKRGKGCEGKHPPPVNPADGKEWKRVQDVRIKTWTAEKSAAKPVVHVVPAHTYGYDCNAGFSKWKLGWSDMKKAWCCEHESRGCQKFSCMSSYDLDKWSADKRDWCCTNFQIACPRTTLSPLGCKTPCTIRGESSTCTERIKLAEKHVFGGKANACNLAYSMIQINCDVCRSCTIEEAGCHVTAFEPFDCDAAFSHFALAWGPTQKKWCCKNRRKGCEGNHTPAVNPGLGKKWKHVQVNGYWTWESVPVGALEYNCTSNFQSWQNDWTDKKKTWCCEHEQRGCGGLSGAGALELCHMAVHGDLSKDGDEAIKKFRYDSTTLGWNNVTCGHAGDKWNGTLLHQAVAKSRLSNVKFLLSHNVEISAQNLKGDTPLHDASDPNVTKLLVGKGAKVDAKNNQGKTPLYLSAQDGRQKVAQLLLKSNATVDSKDNFWGKTPLAAAIAEEDFKMADLLMNHSADPFGITWDGRPYTELTKDDAVRKVLMDQTTDEKLIEEKRVWLGLLLSFLLGLGFALLQQAWQYCSAKEEGYSVLVMLESQEQVSEDDRAFVHGAKLLLAKASAKWIDLPRRMAEVAIKLVLVFACGMWVVSWKYWIVIHALVYGIPFLFTRDFSKMLTKITKMLTSPALLLSAKKPWLDGLRLLLLVAIILILARPSGCSQGFYTSDIGSAVCHATVWVPSQLEESMKVMHMQNRFWEALLRKPYYVWQKTTFMGELYFGSTAHPDFEASVSASHVTITLMVLLFAGSLLHILLLLPACFCGDTAPPSVAKADIRSLLMLTRQGAAEVDPAELLKTGVPSLEAACKCNSFSGFMSNINVKVGLLLLDVFFDVFTILKMLHTGNFKFAYCMLWILSRSLSQQLLSGNLCKLWAARRASVERGIYRHDLLEIFNEEQGFEAFASLALTTYSYWYTVSNARTAALQLASIASSVYGVADYLQRTIDLDIDWEKSSRSLLKAPNF